MVQDNGKGIPPEQLAHLQKQLSLPPDEISDQSQSIGLINVHLRLQLYYRGASMRLESCHPSGVRVILLIPLDLKQGGYPS
jgi:two-component system sensor histidine kinase YesM